jgi:hypothetical protein
MEFRTWNNLWHMKVCTNCATTLGLWLVLWCPCSVTDLSGEVLFPLHVTGPLTQVHRFNTIYIYNLLHGNLRSCHLGGICFWWLVSRLFQRISIKGLLLPAHVIRSFRTPTGYCDVHVFYRHNLYLKKP